MEDKRGTGEIGRSRSETLFDKCKSVTFTKRAAAKAGKYIERDYREAQQAVSTVSASKFGKTFSFEE